MRLLLIPLLAIALTACSNSDKLTLSCYGTKIKIEAGNEIVSPQTTQIYKFQHLRFDNYDCAKHENVISCNFVKEENGTRERKRIIYDTKTLSFAEIIVVWAIGEKVKQDERTISRTEFIGTCQKPILN
jgi:phosphopentomutase